MKVVRHHRSRSVHSAFALFVLLVTLVGRGDAQQSTKVAKIGWLGVGPGLTRMEIFRGALREAGYVEGQNVSLIVRSANNQIEQLPTLVRDLVELKVDVLVIPSTPGALAAKNSGSKIPIVFIGSADPVSAGLVDSLARPGGNITGFSTIAGTLAGKRLELLKESIARLSRVAVLWNARDPTTVQQWQENQSAARDLGLQLYSIDASKRDTYAEMFKVAITSGSNAVTVTNSAIFASQQKTIIELAISNKLPAIYPRRDFVENGGWLSYGPEDTEPFRRAAALVDKILKGAKPADLPVEQPTKFELVINLKTAKQIGLTIPPNVLARADRVIR